MTDRYYVDVDEAIIDNETKREYKTWENNGIQDIADLLNKQDKEIRELREAMKRLMADMMMGGQ